jgi:hypothetical protein
MIRAEIASDLVAESLSGVVEDDAATASQCLCGEPLDLRLWIRGLHQARRMHLHCVEVCGGGADAAHHIRESESEGSGEVRRGEERCARIQCNKGA